MKFLIRILVIGFSIISTTQANDTISKYKPTPEATQQLIQLTKVANYFYNQDRTKVEKLFQTSSKAKEQFSNNPQLYFAFSQLEIFISNLLAYKQTSYTKQELATHNTKNNCRISIEEKVYDISKFITKYESFSVLKGRCGKDQSSLFNQKSIEAKTLKGALAKYTIGSLQ